MRKDLSSSRKPFAAPHWPRIGNFVYIYSSATTGGEVGGEGGQQEGLFQPLVRRLSIKAFSILQQIPNNFNRCLLLLVGLLLTPF